MCCPAAEYLRVTRETLPYLAELDFPWICFHGEDDTLCDPDGSQLLLDASRVRGRSRFSGCQPVPHGGHACPACLQPLHVWAACLGCGRAMLVAACAQISAICKGPNMQAQPQYPKFQTHIHRDSHAAVLVSQSEDKELVKLPKMWHVLIKEPGNDKIIARITEWVLERV